jgi:hypothetical protein
MLSIDEDVGMVSVSMRSAHMGAYSRTDRNNPGGGYCAEDKSGPAYCEKA